jgi:cytoskeletal protein CcmA (bactofilin family)
MGNWQMKKRLSIALGALVALILMYGLAGLGNAQEFRHGNNASIGMNETVNSTAFVTGRNLDIAGEVNGDLFCAGQNVNISGTVHGDVLCAGQNVHITGIIDGDVRVAAQNAELTSAVSGNLTALAHIFNLSGRASVAKDLSGGVNTSTINGSVGRDVAMASTNSTINGSVGRNIKTTVQNLRLGSSAKIGGNVEYASYNQLTKESGANIAGKISRSEPKKHEKHSGWFGIGFRVYWFFAMLLVALALVALFPALFEASALTTLKSPLRTVLLGVAAVLFTPVVFIFLMITIIGIPLGVILMLSWIAALILSGPFFGYLIGRIVWRAQRNVILTMLVGSIIVLLVYNLPILGGLALLAALFIGTGMVVREAIDRFKKPLYKVK